MPFNGSGVFQRVRNWVADATAGIKIRADYHDAEDDGFAAGLSNTITRDGQSLITQNIPFNNKRITGLADPINPQDAATKASVTTLTADKLPLTGGALTGALTSSSTITATGYGTRAGLGGAAGGNWFNFTWDGNVNAYIDNTLIGPLATHARVEERASAWASLRVARTGDTMTGKLTASASPSHIAYDSGGAGLQVFGSSANNHAYMEFHKPGFACNFGIAEDQNFYYGGWSFGPGAWFRFWTTRDFASVPNISSAVTNARWVHIADVYHAGYTGLTEPHGGTAVTGATGIDGAIGFYHRHRALQVLTTSWWTVGYA